MKLLNTPFWLLAFALLLSACETERVLAPDEAERENRQSIFGPGGFSLGGGDKTNANEAPTAGLGVNAFLWRATLDTMSVWPIASADPFGGVVITDWYAPPAAPSERFKLNIFILDRALRADGIRVSVFRQVLAQNGQWLDARVQVETATRLENAILTRARQFRNETAQQ